MQTASASLATALAIISGREAGTNSMLRVSRTGRSLTAGISESIAHGRTVSHDFMASSPMEIREGGCGVHRDDLTQRFTEDRGKRPSNAPHRRLRGGGPRFARH